MGRIDGIVSTCSKHACMRCCHLQERGRVSMLVLSAVRESL
jgi:hypothetical protein